MKSSKSHLYTRCWRAWRLTRLESQSVVKSSGSRHAEGSYHSDAPVTCKCLWPGCHLHVHCDGATGSMLPISPDPEAVQIFCHPVRDPSAAGLLRGGMALSTWHHSYMLGGHVL